MSQAPARELRILNYAWHTGHQYELYKLPHRFTLAVRPGALTWKFKHRPLSPRVRVAREEDLDLGAFDVALLHFDHHLLEPWPGGEHPFLHYARALQVPKVAICHGTPPETEDGQVDEEHRQRVVDAVGDVLVVCNSRTAYEGWGFRRAQTIWHGLDPDEYPPTRGGRGILTIGHFNENRLRYQGYEVYKRVAAELPCELLWSRGQSEFKTAEPSAASYPLRNLLFKLFRQGKRPRELSRVWLRLVANPYARARFAAYRRFIRRYQTYFNPTLLSPMPRSRCEAMFSGLAIVTTNCHDEERFLENEVDGYYSNDPDQLLDYLRFLTARPEVAREVGLRGREKARQVFGLERFHADWQRLLADLVR